MYLAMHSRVPSVGSASAAGGDLVVRCSFVFIPGEQNQFEQNNNDKNLVYAAYVYFALFYLIVVRSALRDCEP